MINSGKIYTVLAATLLLTFGLAVGCAHDGNCNNRPQRPSPTPSPSPDESASPSPNPQPQTNANTPNAEINLPIKNGPKVLVFKNSGEQQCGMSPGISLEEMKTTLTNKKIPVLDAHTQPDGLMHMALCGAPSGKIHVFRIPKEMLKKAEKLGFKIWVNKAS